MAPRCGMLQSVLALPILLMLVSGPVRADGDPALGKVQFAQCSSCHSISADEADHVGPNLFRVYGKAAATNRPGFAYSDVLKHSGLTWNDETLDSWLKKPMAKVPGTKMAFLGIANDEIRQNIIAYLKTER